jgi:hypothetical protein
MYSEHTNTSQTIGFHHCFFLIASSRGKIIVI